MKHTLLLFLITLSLSAQIKGVVKDSISGKPIPFASVWVQNENIGTTSEENGEFKINLSDKNKKLIFSAIGFEKKILRASESSVVILKPMNYQLDEVVIAKHFETKIIEIGKTKNEIRQAFDNGPKIDTKFFPFKSEYKKIKYIKKVSIYTDCSIEEATIKLHFFSVDSEGYPGEEMLSKDVIVALKKGAMKHYVDLSNYNLKMPKTGLFVGYEKLLVEKNKVEKLVEDANSNTKTIKTSYQPLVLYNFVESEFLFSYSGGKWHKEVKLDDKNQLVKMRVFEPAINLVLTN